MKHIGFIGKRMSLVLIAGTVACMTLDNAFAQNGGGGGNRQPGGNGQRGNNGGNNRGGGGGRGGFMGGFGQMMEPAYTTRNINKYSDMLGLSKDQKTAVDALYEGYQQEANSAAEKMRAAMSDARDNQDWSKIGDAGKAFRDQRKKLDASFASDFKAVLTPAQTEKWPQVEMAQRRDSSLRRGFISGERVDLFSLVDEVKPSADTKKTLQPILDQYAQDLDRELVKRNDMQEKSMEKLGELRQSGDMEAAQKLIEEGRALSVKVRDVNRSFAKQVAAALPEDQKTAFNDAFKKASFPDVYRTSNASNALKAAAGFKDLTADQTDAISKLTASYDKSVGPVNDKLATAQEDQEMKFNIANFGRAGQGQDNPAAEVRREKRDLDRSTMDSLKKILTEDQQKKLPQADDRGYGAGGGRGRGGQGGGGRPNQDI